MPSVLLVENDENYARLFQRLFSQAALHWRQLWVKDGSAAVRHMVNESFPHLLVTGLRTSKLGGVEVIEWVRAMKCSNPVPVIIWDDALGASQQEALAKLGVTEYLNRHLPEDKIKSVLGRLIAQIESESGSPSPSPAEAKAGRPA